MVRRPLKGLPNELSCDDSLSDVDDSVFETDEYDSSTLFVVVDRLVCSGELYAWMVVNTELGFGCVGEFVCLKAAYVVVSIVNMILLFIWVAWEVIELICVEKDVAGAMVLEAATYHSVLCNITLTIVQCTTWNELIKPYCCIIFI